MNDEFTTACEEKLNTYKTLEMKVQTSIEELKAFNEMHLNWLGKELGIDPSKSGQVPALELVLKARQKK